MQAGPGPRPYDTSLGYLIELDPTAWLDWIELPADGPVHSIESDVGTVLAEVDKVVRVDGASPWLAHIELQASYDPRLRSRLMQYHALLHHRHQIPVETTVVLLRPAADDRELTGRFELHSPSGRPTISFNYRVIRLWECPVEEVLDGSLAIVPLAPLAAVEPERLPEVVRRLDERLGREALDTTSEELWTATLLLLRLRYDERQVRELVQEMSRLRESPVYELIVEMGREQGREEGRLTQTRQILLDLGAEKLGPPDETVVQTVGSIDDLDTLQHLIRRILTTTSWQELLATVDDR